jgi:hypothetical protein
MDNADIAIVQTVCGNMDSFIKREVKYACAACKAQVMLGHRTNCTFLGMVGNNMIFSCPMIPAVVTNAHTIFCPDLAGVWGRTVRRLPNTVTTEYMQILQAILDCFHLVTLAAVIMFVNGAPFLVSMACGLNLVTAKHTPSKTAKKKAAGIKRVMALYSHGGFHVGTILMDNKFEKLRDLMPEIIVNTIAAKEHVPEVKRCIQLIKEQGWGILNTLLSKQCPKYCSSSSFTTWFSG